MNKPEIPVADHTGAYFVSMPEAARRLGMSKWTIYEWKTVGRLRTVSCGRRELVAIDELQRLAAVIAAGRGDELMRDDEDGES